MARVLTNNVSLRYGIEPSLGAEPTSGNWRILEPNNMAAYGAAIEKVVRRPISPTRGRRKGTTVSLDSNVEFEGDVTLDSFTDFIEGFCFASAVNGIFDLKSSVGPPAVAPPVTSGNFVIAAASAALGDLIQFVSVKRASLVMAKGYTNAVNNGLHAIDADVATSSTTISVPASLVNETPPTNASLIVAGVRVLETSDLTFAWSGSTATLTSVATTGAIVAAGGTTTPGWASLGVVPGMVIHIGSINPSTGVVQNGLGTSGTEAYGYARVTAINSTNELALDKLDVKLTPSAGPFQNTAGVCDILIPRMVRNVATSASDYLERTYQFEATYPGLEGAPSTPAYEYVGGQYANELAISLAVADKATATWGFIGTTAPDITNTRHVTAPTPATALTPLRTTALNTSSDLVSITTDVVSAASDVCFKDLTLTITNNESPERCLGDLSPVAVNSGLFEVNLEGQMLFTRKEIVNAVKNNTTVTFQAIMNNEDGAIAIDLPSLTFGDGSREFPVDESVLVNLTGETFTSPTLGYDLGISILLGTPTVR